MMNQVGGVDNGPDNSEGVYYNPQLSRQRNIALEIAAGVEQGIPLDAVIIRNIINNPGFKAELMEMFPGSYRPAFDFVQRNIDAFRRGDFSVLRDYDQNEERPRVPEVEVLVEEVLARRIGASNPVGRASASASGGGRQAGLPAGVAVVNRVT